MAKNKYGGINDMPSQWCANNKRVYVLWYDMLRRCYDSHQLSRKKGQSYKGCTVCDEWLSLSVFDSEIKLLEGYEDWASGERWMLDKDTVLPGNKTYSAKTCRFISESESNKEMAARNKNLTRAASLSRKIKYEITKNCNVLSFDSEKETCTFLGVVKCSVASCFRRGSKCKGYTIARIGAFATTEQEAPHARH